MRYIQAHFNDLSSVEDSLLMVNVLIASGCVSTAFQVVCKVCTCTYMYKWVHDGTNLLISKCTSERACY